MTPKTTPRPPKHLSPSSKKWFREVVTTWALEEHHRRLLVGACEALDRAAEARKAIETDGPYFKNRFGEVRKHPAIGVERDSMAVFARFLRELALDIDAPPAAPRPSTLLSMTRGVHHAG
jgi:P27 family predicted phage terminase small subunit